MPLERALILTCEKCAASLTFTGEMAEEMGDRDIFYELAGAGWLYVPDGFSTLDGECFCPEHKSEEAKQEVLQ